MELTCSGLEIRLFVGFHLKVIFGLLPVANDRVLHEVEQSWRRGG